MRFLKIVTIFAPFTFLAAFEFARHFLFFEKHPMLLGNLVLMGVVLTGSFLFSRFIFGRFEAVRGELIRRNAELAAMNTVALAASESLELDLVLQRAMEKVLDVTAADSGEVFLFDDAREELVQRIQVGPHAEAFREKTRFRVGEGIIGSVAQNEEPEVMDIPQDHRLLRRKLIESGFRYLACVPLKVGNKVIGVFDVATLRSRNFSPDDLYLLVNIGNQIAVAIENAQLHRRVRSIAVLEERERIAREMHDGLVQVLSYIDLKAQAVRTFLETNETAKARAHLQELEQSAQEVYADAREAIFGLRINTHSPNGLVESIKEYVVRFNRLGVFEVTMEVNGRRDLSLSSAAQLQIIRIVQEALTNVRKHSRAANAWIRISGQSELVTIEIEDDGRGFDPSEIAQSNMPHFGLQTMKERAESVGGSLEIRTEVGHGCKIVVRVPQVQEAPA